MHPDPHGQAFPPVLLNTGPNSNNNNNKTMSSSLDSVPMSLGSPAIIPHSDYGAVAPYMSAQAFISKSRPSGSGAAAAAQRQLPPRTPSSGTGQQQNAAQKHHRTRTNSINSVSSGASTGIVSSITSTLGATNISFPDSPSSVGMVNSNNQSMGMTGAGEEEDMDEFNSSSTSKPRPGGHPRKAIAARVFECSFPGCNKAYTQLHNLKSHERTGHTPIQKPKPFLCIIQGCNKAFSQRKSLAMHIRASHKEYKFKPFKCSQMGCQKSYTQLHNLRTHEKTVHMLDLSRKRIRNPAEIGNGNGGGNGGGMSIGNDSNSCVNSSQQNSQGGAGYGSSFARDHPIHMSDSVRNQFTSNMELRYESLDGLADYAVEMRGEGDEEEEEEEEELDGEEDNDDDYEEE
ncbi:hypothetical protein BGZ58_004143 [Dissophora ornata]|nr:hypothetical protein BGZ58_004143 [Dissophora ornata]